jgi:hypothetical protein
MVSFLFFLKELKFLTYFIEYNFYLYIKNKKPINSNFFVQEFDLTNKKKIGKKMERKFIVFQY